MRDDQAQMRAMTWRVKARNALRQEYPLWTGQSGPTIIVIKNRCTSRVEGILIQLKFLAMYYCANTLSGPQGILLPQGIARIHAPSHRSPIQELHIVSHVTL